MTTAFWIGVGCLLAIAVFLQATALLEFRGDIAMADALDKLEDNAERAPQVVGRLRARGKYVQANRIESALKRNMFVDEFLQHVENVLSRCSASHPRFAAQIRTAYGVKASQGATCYRSQVRMQRSTESLEELNGYGSSGQS